MDGNRELMGHKVAVVALSRHNTSYVPLSEASLYSLFPDPLWRGGRSAVVSRLADIRVERSPESGKLHGRCAKWWDVPVLLEQRRNNVRGSARALQSLADLQRALERNFASPFGADLPIFVDSASSCARVLDWDALELDVVRGLNSQIPFDYHLSRRVRPLVMSELPFLDVEEHFRSVMPDQVLVSLIRQLIDQHTRQVRGMTLLPVRWVSCISAADTVVVAAGVPMVMTFSDPMKVRVRVGALDVSLRRAGSGQHSRRQQHRCVSAGQT